MFYTEDSLSTAADDMARRRAESTRIAAIVVLLMLTQAVSLDAKAAAESDDGLKLDEIVVTAQKRSENLQNVPISITAVTGATLSDVNVDAQTSLARITPDLSYTFNSNFVSPYIRGVGTQFAEAGLESSIATYVDDIYQARATGLMMGMADIARVEVLKGPQGTLYGRNATGGAIRIITNDPVDKLTGNFSALGGNYGRQAYEGMVNIPITDKLFWRISMQSDERDGYLNPINPGVARAGSLNNFIVHSKLLFVASEDFSAKLTVNYSTTHDRAGQGFIALNSTAPEQIGVALGGKPPVGFYDQSGGAIPKDRSKQLGISLRLDKTFEGLVVSSISSFSDTSSIANADLDSTGIPLESAYSDPEITKDYTQEFQLVTTGSGPWKTIGGLFFLYETNDMNFGVYGIAIDPTSNGNFDSVGNGNRLQTNYRVNVTSIAPYGQTTYTFNDQWDLTVGARYTHEKKTEPFHDLASPNIATQTAPVLFTSAYQEATFSKFTPKVTLSDHITHDLMAYASYGQGFKSGGLSNPSFTPTLDVVKPETINAYEVGWKFENERLRFNGSAFYYDYKDLTVQFTDQVSGGVLTRNAASAKIYGLESDVSYVLTQNFQVGAGGAYLHSKYADFSGAAAQTYVPASTTPACTAANPAGCLGYSIAANQNFDGNELTVAPKETGYLKLQYDLPLGGQWGAVHFTTLASYTGKFYYSSDHALSEPSKTLLTASLMWTSEDDRYFVKAFGDNLTNKDYDTWKTYQATGGWRVPGMPLTWGVQTGVRF